MLLAAVALKLTPLIVTVAPTEPETGVKEPIKGTCATQLKQTSSNIIAGSSFLIICEKLSAANVGVYRRMQNKLKI